MTAIPQSILDADLPRAALFRPLPKAARPAIRARYLAWLRERDGELDFDERTLTRREDYFRDIDSAKVRWPHPLDVQAFHSRHEGGPFASTLTPELLWLLIAAKANRAERFGVEKAIRRARSQRPGADPAEGFVEVEEFYHTRILLDALRCFGLEVELLPPSAMQRAAVDSMVYLPVSLGLPAVLCAEVCGSTLFEMLLVKSGELFASAPPVQARVRSLLQEILVDELGHIAFCRSRMGPAALAFARMLLPTVQAALVHDIPEVEALFGPGRYSAAVRAFDPDKAALRCSRQAFLLDAPLATA